MAEKTKGAAKAPPAVQRLMVMNDKGGIGKSIVVHGLSLELAAASVDHRVIEVESNPRLQRVLGKDRVLYHALSDESLRDIRRNPDLVGEFWDAVAEEFTDGIRLLDMGANAGTLFWNWWDSGSGRLMLGDGTGMGVLIITTAEVEALRLARETLARVAEEMPNAKLFVVVNEHQGAMPANHPALDGLRRRRQPRGRGRADRPASMRGAGLAGHVRNGQATERTGYTEAAGSAAARLSSRRRGTLCR
jgi:hypothetical protein